MKENKHCFNCLKGKVITINGDILCHGKGPVSPNYLCSKHVLSDQYVSRKVEFKCINCENFLIDYENGDESCTIGLCQMFSVRTFDGAKKKACSKYVKKHRRSAMKKTACTI